MVREQSWVGLRAHHRRLFNYLHIVCHTSILRFNHRQVGQSVGQVKFSELTAAMGEIGLQAEQVFIDMLARLLLETVHVVAEEGLFAAAPASALGGFFSVHGSSFGRHSLRFCYPFMLRFHLRAC